MRSTFEEPSGAGTFETPLVVRQPAAINDRTDHQLNECENHLKETVVNVVPDLQCRCCDTQSLRVSLLLVCS